MRYIIVPRYLADYMIKMEGKLPAYWIVEDEVEELEPTKFTYLLGDDCGKGLGTNIKVLEVSKYET